MSKDPYPQVTALALSLGAECRWENARGNPYVAQFHVVRDGSDLFCEPSLGSKGALMGLEVFAPVLADVAGAKVRLTREGGVDRLGKKLGVTREMQTGDAMFDREVFIDSDAPDTTLARLFGAAEVRDAVRALLAIGGAEVGMGTVPTSPTAGSSFVKLGITWEHTRDRARLEQLLSALVRVAHAFGTTRMDIAGYRGAPPADREKALPPRKLRGGLAIALVLVPPIVSCFLPTGHSLGGHLLLAGYGAAFGLWLVQGVLLMLLLRGRSSSFTMMLTGWGIAFLGIVLVARDVDAMNELLDSGKPSRHRAYARFHVASKGPSYVEVTAIWLPDKPTARSCEDDASLRPSEGDVLVMAVTRPGAFGVPWVENVERIGSP